jgi:hypothetical protein
LNTKMEMQPMNQRSQMSQLLHRRGGNIEGE